MSLFEEIGDELGNHFTTDELISLAELIEQAAEACDYAADDLAYRIEDEQGYDTERYESATVDRWEDAQRQLGELAAAIRAGEIRGREDHPA